MLTLDAVEYAPTLWGVLTAREHLTRAECRRHLRQLLVAARRRWPAVEWFVQVEFQRRGALHLNLLVKGVPVGDVDELRDVLVERWCARVDAGSGREHQWFGTVSDAEGVVKYLAKTLAHGLKAEQAPPIGWRGHRTSQTRGYLVRPAGVMRDEAKRSLRLKRKLWRGASLEVAQHELEQDEAVEWSLARVNPSTADLSPTATRLDPTGAGLQPGQADSDAGSARACDQGGPPVTRHPRRNRGHAESTAGPVGSSATRDGPAGGERAP